MKTILLIFTFLLVVSSVLAQSIRIPKNNDNSGIISGKSVSILIPRRVKIEKAVAQIDTVIKQKLEDYMQKMLEEKAITKDVKTSVNAKVIEEKDSTTGKKELNFHVEYKYEVVKAKLESQTDDFPSGKYKLIASNAAKITMQQLKQAVENQLMEYLSSETKVTIKITGSTDGTPINKSIPYGGEYGDFEGTEYFLNDNLNELNLTTKTGITSNGQLAFLRTYGVRDFIEKFVEQLSVTKNSYQHYAVVSNEIGAQYRRISVEIIIHDAFKGKFTENQPLAENEIKQSRSEVDKNIPVSDLLNDKTYALIIGNEDYSSFQTGLKTEANVDFAGNDAMVFKEYCIKTLGVPEKNVTLKLNATMAQMRQSIARIATLAELSEGTAKLIFYYSGHGLPDEATHEAYIIPVDVSGTDVKNGIKLDDLYKQLTEFPTKQVSVFLDACFSGGARNEGLVSLKGVVVKAKKETLIGNIVVFASSSAEESSMAYKEKQHGMFTYFLLKKLQETKGEVSFRELSDYIQKQVPLESMLINSKDQTPTTSGSQEVMDKWEEWKLR